MLKNNTINENQIPSKVHQQLVYMNKHLKLRCKNILENIFSGLSSKIISWFTQQLINKHVFFLINLC